MTIPEALLALSGSLGLSILVKATVLLTLGLTVTRLAKRARASVRHLASLGGDIRCAARASACYRDRSASRDRHPRHLTESGADCRAGAKRCGRNAVHHGPHGSREIGDTVLDQHCSCRVDRRHHVSIPVPQPAPAAAAAHSPHRNPVAGSAPTRAVAGHRVWRPETGRRFAARGHSLTDHVRPVAPGDPAAR